MLQIRAVTHGNSIFLSDNDVISNSIRDIIVQFMSKLEGEKYNNIRVTGIKKR